MRVFKYAPDPDWNTQTCPGCLWLVYNLYTLAETQEQADQHKADTKALCGDCLCEVMSDGGHEVTGVE